MPLLSAQQPATLQRAELLGERAGLGAAAGRHGDVPENPTVLQRTNRTDHVMCRFPRGLVPFSLRENRDSSQVFIRIVPGRQCTGLTWPCRLHRAPPEDTHGRGLARDSHRAAQARTAHRLGIQQHCARGYGCLAGYDALRRGNRRSDLRRRPPTTVHIHDYCAKSKNFFEENAPAARSIEASAIVPSDWDFRKNFRTVGVVGSPVFPTQKVHAIVQDGRAGKGCTIVKDRGRQTVERPTYRRSLDDSRRRPPNGFA